MKFKLDMINNIVIISLVVVMGFALGNAGRNLITNEQTEIVKPVVKTDTLLLKNGGEIEITMVDDEKIISMTYEDFKYIKKGFRKTVKNIEGLFARMEEK